MQHGPDGFYALYMAAHLGEGMGMLVLRDGVLCGSDITGGQFDGSYISTENGDGFDVSVTITIPPNVNLIQGTHSGAEGMQYIIKYFMPINFLDLPYLVIETPYGKVNARLIKLREIK